MVDVSEVDWTAGNSSNCELLVVVVGLSIVEEGMPFSVVELSGTESDSFKDASVSSFRSG